MPRFLAADRTLMLLSMAWLVGLWLAPFLVQTSSAFFVTATLVAANATYSFRTLTRTRQVPVFLNCTQIVLFGVLNNQLFHAFGSNHYRCDREPRFFDWIEFTAAHVLRAADVLDALDEWGWNIQIIVHNSAVAGLLLILMHVTVDAFLIDLALRCLRRWCPDPPRETRLAQGRREVGWFLVTAALFAFFAVGLQMEPIDWLRWPLDQLLRLVDVGDVLQIFGWKLHGLESNAWSDGAAFIFRLAAGIWMARFVILWRLTVFRTWGLGVEELKNLLDDPDATVRRAAASGLGQSGALAQIAVGALGEALHDLDSAVRCEAAWALGQIGPDARPAVPDLIAVVWCGERDLRLAAIEALALIGPGARLALPELVCLLKVGDRSTRHAVARALQRIAPTVLPRLPKHFGGHRKKRHAVPRTARREAAWQRSLDADRTRKRHENAVHDLLVALVTTGFFGAERTIDEIVNRMSVDLRAVKAGMLVLPLVRLTAAGTLKRRRNRAGQRVYAAESPHVITEHEWIG